MPGSTAFNQPVAENDALNQAPFNKLTNAEAQDPSQPVVTTGELELAQSARSRVLAADRQAPSVAEGVSLHEPAQSTSSAAPPPRQRADSIDHAVGAGIIAVTSPWAAGSTRTTTTRR